ncbi:c-type heme family protein [Salidesulfovibrio brasiliensis]|uniref:c-type heme family protein n=1 Tax=Salidesulfovibrio brasiliensis TaxID=221711 RepID=UPI0006D0FDA2|nr:DUF3365 domain-containing protein [Salidesulfovibrio brasiliensis]
MINLRPQTLQVKFLLGLGAIVLIMGIFFSASMYFHLKSLLDSEVRDRAELALAQVDSVQRYVREDLRPKMFSVLPQDEFVIEAMSSSYISRNVMDRVAPENGDVLYRRVSVNARNPDYEAQGVELELLERFRKHPDEQSWQGYKKIDGTEYFITSRPVIFKKQCMYCHGTPEEAPRILLDRYGTERGFGRKLGALDGVDLVGFPVDDAVTQIRDATVGYVGIYGAGMFVFFAIVQGFFNRLVTANLKRLTRVFRERFSDKEEIKALDRMEHSDEIDEMVHGMEELGDHLLTVQEQLRDNAANLERTVAQRTAQLSREAFERKADVTLFVRLLDALNRSQSRKEMWTTCLPLLAERFHAQGAAFTCMLASQNKYFWPEEASIPALPDNWKDVLVDGEPYPSEQSVLIPVGATSAASEGLLTLWWDTAVFFEDKDHDIMRALGTQLGIAMENIGALDNLLNQKDMLQSIVEGIADPLLLLEGSCSVVVANFAARKLADDVASGNESGLLPILFAEHEDECPFRQALTKGLSYTQEVAVDGRQFVVSLYPVGGDSRAVAYVREVTAERQMMAQIRQSEKLATVGRFAAGLAHEMNNPLGVIKCYGELLKNGPCGEEIRGDTDVILKHATQAQNVLQDLLDFARPGKTDGATVDIRQGVEDMVGVFGVQARASDVSVGLHVEPDFPEVSVDQQALHQIVSNLFNNALDAVGSNGAIRFRLFVDEEEIPSLEVRDNGPGLPSEIKDSIFEPFFTTKDVGKGTGLGLAVVYGLLQDMGGSIKAYDDGGAVFTIRFASPKRDKA